MSRWRTLSLRGRLLALLLGAMALAWAVVVASSYVDARHEINEMLDAHLAQSAALLIAQAGHEGPHGLALRERRRGGENHDEPEGDEDRRVDIVAPAHRYERRVAFQIWEEGGGLRLRSASAPAVRLAAEEQGFSDVLLQGDRWRVFSRRDAFRHLLVQVGERYEFRDSLAKSIAGNLLDPLWVALPALALLVWFGVGRGLSPLVRVNQQLASRAPDYLDPVDAGGAPAEVQPLIDTLNRLLSRVRTALESERRFTADAAHELRTPLAALKTQAQVASAAGDEGVRRHALEQLAAGCDRASHLVEQLLTLARLDPQQAPARFAPVDLRAVASGVVAEVAPAALAKDIELGLAESGGAPVQGDGAMLAVLVRNLVDNAVRYTQPAGEVAVSVEAVAGHVQLLVSDNGPGIPLEERAKVGQRFYRVLGSGESGSGLGLSIVRRICELHGAVMSLTDAAGGRGLSVRVSFPPAGGDSR